MVAGRALVAAVSVAAALASIASSVGARDVGPPSTVYRLRGDPRMCPSPVCGGYWASRINFKLTTCLDGAVLPACYAASVDLSPLPGSARKRARAALAATGAFVEGRFGRFANSAAPQLAKLVASRMWIPAGDNIGGGTVYRVVDTGIRCVRAPCFSLRATVVNGTRSLMLSGLDLGRAGVPPEALARARETLSRDAVLVTGAFRVVTKPGANGPARTLVASQVWLPA